MVRHYRFGCTVSKRNSEPVDARGNRTDGTNAATNQPPLGTPAKPTRSELLKPVELVSISAIMALFVGLTIVLTTRNWALTGIAFGITFIVALVTIAMLALGDKPNAAEKRDLDEQNSRH
jgi:hypothetical protein